MSEKEKSVSKVGNDVEEKKSLFFKIMETTLEQAIEGIGKGKVASCKELAEEYLERSNGDKKTAARKMANVQMAKSAMSGFLTNLGGLITLPIAIPADLSAVWFIQLRMIAAIAVMAGLNPKKDEVKTHCYACLSGQGGNEIIKRAGVEFSKRGGYIMVGKIPAATLRAINQKIGIKLFTKFGEKGIINIGKGVPLIGGAVGGTFDFVSTAIIANTAIKKFLN